MDFVATSDPFVLIAWIAGFATLTISAGLTLQVLRIRRRSVKRARREAEFVATWRPILFEAALGGAPEIPRVAEQDEDTFLHLWNDLQETLHGDSRPALNRVAVTVGADVKARRRLRDDDAVARVHALRMIGHLGRAEDYPLVRDLLDDPRAWLSLAAARALVRIDPVAAPHDVLPRIGARADWPASLLVTALSDANRDQLASALHAACSGAPAEKVIRLLPIVGVVDERAGDEILRLAYAEASDPEVAAAVLKYARTASLADLARGACGHAAWSVRTQAAAALGRIGAAADRPLLLKLLTDPQWWVRYRAAQALVSGRFGASGEIAAQVDALEDRYARDILAHANAEGQA